MKYSIEYSNLKAGTYIIEGSSKKFQVLYLLDILRWNITVKNNN